MKRIFLQLLVLTLFFLLVFLAFNATGLEKQLATLVTNRAATFGTAVLMFALLVSDVILPVPSSVVMTANGALFGVVLGAGISALGSFAASCIGYALGRVGWTRKFFKPEETVRNKHDAAASKVIAVILTRPLPLLAEAFSVLAGVQRMSFPTFAAASAAGAIPIAVLYSVIGSGISQNHSPSIFILAYLAVAGAAIVAARFFYQKSTVQQTARLKN